MQILKFFSLALVLLTTGCATTAAQHRALIRTQRQLHDREGGVRQWLLRQEAVVQHDQTNIQGFRQPTRSRSKDCPNSTPSFGSACYRAEQSWRRACLHAST
mgnify:CR=1 FL=1